MSFEDILRHHQRINALSRSLIGRSAFEEIHVMLPDPICPEPAFIRATSWLYCLYYEGGRVSILFLRRIGETNHVMDRDRTDQHLEAVRCLRTELHHNLGFADSDQQARTVAELWRRKSCGTAIPEKAEHWLECYNHLIEDAVEFLGGIETIVRQIESDGDNAKDKIEDWNRRLARSWPAASFDPLIEDSKRQLGREALNTVAFRNRYINRWRKQLEILDDGFDFEHEAILLIEKALLDENCIVIPVTGRDIIDMLHIAPGPIVGNLLKEASLFFESNRCNKDELLDHIRSSYEKQG